LGAAHTTTVITVKRGTAKEDYSVPVESKQRRASADSEQGQALH